MAPITVNATEFRAQIEDKGKVEACYQFTQSHNEAQADAFIATYINKLLYANRKAAAATVLLGHHLFNPKPWAVRRVWSELENFNKLLLQGGGALGKSYSPIVWILLDWLQDPNYTNTKLISTTAGHAKANTFSTLIRLIKECVIPLPCTSAGNYVGLDPKEHKSGIEIIAIPQGQDGRGRLQGFHPDPRPQPHPIYGTNSRCRAFMDEAEEIPIGVNEGIDNMLLSMDNTGTVKIIGAYNPRDPSSKTAQNAEPPNGWETFDVETGVDGHDEWTSKNGWRVCRLDGAKSENVRHRTIVYGGFMTFEGYRELETKNGGNTPEYYTFGRGAYPPEGVNNTIIPAAFLGQSRGEFIFVGRPISAGGVDTAVDGRDAAVFTKARAGLATGFKSHKTGEIIRFTEPRQCIQIEQQFELRKGSTKIVGDDITGHAKALGIQPEYLSIDSTGNGAAVHAYASIAMPGLQGVDFNANASHIKILEQDKKFPDEIYDGLVTEVWYALRYFMEFGYMALSPGLRGDPLNEELMGRRYKLSAGDMVRVEKKDDYRKRLGRSPDYADSLTIVVHGIRMRQHVFGSMTGESQRNTPKKPVKHSPIDRPAYLDVSGV